MKLFIILVAVACITHVSDGWRNKKKGPWYDFWKKPANSTNHILKYFYCRSKNFSDSTLTHTLQWVEGARRLWFVFTLGTCPERIKTTTTTTSTTTEPPTKYPTPTPWPRGRARKYPLVYHEDEQDYVTKPLKTTPVPPPTTRCPPKLRRPKLRLQLH